MSLVAIGLNHHTAPLAIREKLAFPAEQLPAALAAVIGAEAAREAAIVSTCNRTELYASTPDAEGLVRWLAQHRGLTAEELRPYLYLHTAEAAAHHAFRVASGLDSMVLGETQIVGQIKDAVRAAEASGTLGTLLNTLFQKTFSTAKAVRSQTGIGANSVSMAAAGVRLAEQIFPSLQELHVLFIGAGEMIELVATHFAAQKPASITIANRTLARGAALAERFGGTAIILQDLPSYLPKFDVVVTSTASPLPILGKGAVERALKARRHRPIFMLDLAVPRDIEGEVAKLNDVFLYTVDDIAAVVEVGKEERRAAADTAEDIIHAHTQEFARWLEGRDAVPVIRALRDEAERVRRHTLDAALKRLHKGDAAEDVLTALSQQLTNKLLHPPLQALNTSQGDTRTQLVGLVAKLYNLHPD
jgi:glutamyl-tRNA reductase